MTLKLEITDKVLIGANDDNMLPLERCVCGEEFGYWEFTLDSDPGYTKSECPKCGRKMWFEITIKVFQEYEPVERPLVPYDGPVSDELWKGFPEGIHDDD